MDIYIVKHFYDNGLSYEDYRQYEDNLYYSSLELAENQYFPTIGKNFTGKYSVIKMTLDTNESNVIHETEYIHCNFDDYMSEEEQEELQRLQAEEDEYWEMYMEQLMNQNGQYDYEDEEAEPIPDNTVDELNILLDEQLQK